MRFAYRVKYRPTALELSVVVAEIAIMLLFAWSFLAGPPTEAFVELMAALGIRTPRELMLVLSVLGACLSPLSLVAERRINQRRWYQAAVLPLVFYSAAIAYYRIFVQSGAWTGIVVFLTVAVVLLLLAAATFRDCQPRQER